MVKKFVRRVLNLAGYDIVAMRPGSGATPGVGGAEGGAGAPYHERVEFGPSNIETKFANVQAGLPFEFPEMLNLNAAVARLIGDARRIGELGSGTGTFANLAAEKPGVQVFASEFDKQTHDWVLEHKSHPRVKYFLGPLPDDEPTFDLIVAIDVIEHVADYRGFLTECCRRADRALISTPNRARSRAHFHSGPPEYVKHVREWTAGEFYWVLRAFYSEVRLYGMTSQEQPTFVAVDVDTRLSALIADCRRPL